MEAWRLLGLVRTEGTRADLVVWTQDLAPPDTGGDLESVSCMYTKGPCCPPCVLELQWTLASHYTHSKVHRLSYHPHEAQNPP